MELLLRMPGSSAAPSPFEAALRRVASGGHVDLAAPYLSIALLRELTASGAAFRLVTDAEEWRRAYARPARREILSFIADHGDRVRHYRDLHEKVAVSRTKQLQVELANWFESVWSRGVPVDGDMMREPEICDSRDRGSNVNASALRAA